MKRTKPNKNKRALRLRILIMCEGETERNYFQAIKEDPDYKKTLSAVNPQIAVAKNSAPEWVVKEAITKAEQAFKEGNEYDKVWVVFDHDNSANRQAAYEAAKKELYEIAFSSIAFEKWYLIHFVRSTRSFSNADELIKVLKKYYKDYEKAKQNDFTKLKDKLDTARSNAIWLRAQVFENDSHLTDCNPWTDVDVLVWYLISIKE